MNLTKQHILKEALQINPSSFIVLSYIFTIHQEGNALIDSNEIALKFSLPLNTVKATFYFIKNAKRYEEIIQVKYDNKKPDIFFIKIIDNFLLNTNNIAQSKHKKKTSVNQQDTDLYNRLFIWVKNWYEHIEFSYTDIDAHKPRIKTICGKIKTLLKSKEENFNNDSIESTFYIIFDNLPNWWIDNGALRLNTISKNFDTIINQIKTNNGNRKANKFSRAAAETQYADYSDIGGES